MPDCYKKSRLVASVLKQGWSGRGFTLIELSIVLVIIGLIVGGVLVGRDLINAATLRAQTSQIEKYQQAVHAFQGKYGYLPGDISNPDASRFGFAARGQYAGEGDGNGVIEGISASGGGHNWGVYQTGGETAMFWVDLTSSGLIAERFNTATPSTTASQTITSISTPNLANYLPKAAIGRGNYIEVWSYSLGTSVLGFVGNNYMAILGITSLDAGGTNAVVATPQLTVLEAYKIDSKIDDGKPLSGHMIAAWGKFTGVPWVGAGDNSATPASSSTCYDNNNVGGATQQYSIIQNNGTGANCALSYKFQ